MLSVHVPEPAETLILGNIACVTECRPQSLPYIEFLTKCHSIYPHIGLQQGNMYAHNGGQNRYEFALEFLISEYLLILNFDDFILPNS